MTELSTMCLPPQLERVVTALPETQSQLAAASERADLVLATVKQLEIRSMLTDQTLEEMEVRDGNNFHIFFPRVHMPFPECIQYTIRTLFCIYTRMNRMRII